MKKNPLIFILRGIRVCFQLIRMTWWSRHSMQEREPFQEELEFQKKHDELQSKRMNNQKEGK